MHMKSTATNVMTSYKDKSQGDTIPQKKTKTSSLLRRLEETKLEDIDEEHIAQLNAEDKLKIDPEKLERMIKRRNRKFGIFYPEDPLKNHWDIFITVVLIASCFITPYRIAFGP